MSLFTSNASNCADALSAVITHISGGCEVSSSFIPLFMQAG